MTLATRLLVEEALEGESRDVLGGEHYEHGASPGQGWRNSVPMGRLHTAEAIVDYGPRFNCHRAYAVRRLRRRCDAIHGAHEEA